MTSLNLAKNTLVPPSQWRARDNDGLSPWVHTDGRTARGDRPTDPPDCSGIIAIANAIPNMRALSSINLLKNHIAVEQAQKLVKIMRSKEKLLTLCGLSKEETKLDFSNQGLKVGDAVLIANDISDMGALLVLSLNGNLLGADGGKALAKGLKGNQVITELNIADNNLSNGGTGMSGVIALAHVIPNMGAIVQFTFSGDSDDSKPVTMETSMTEADFSGKGLGPSGAIMLSAFLPKCT
jgi:hypothetical protein